MTTLIAKNHELSYKKCPQKAKEKERMKKVPYANAIGCLMYVMMCIRPDIYYVVGLISKFQSNPGIMHWKAVKRVLRYLKGTVDFSLCYQ